MAGGNERKGRATEVLSSATRYNIFVWNASG